MVILFRIEVDDDFFSQQPYTPSGQTPFLTPYTTPHSQQTPRYGQQTPSPQMAPTNAPPHVNGPFLHPGAVTPSQRTPSYRSISQSPTVQHSPHLRSYNTGGDHRGGGSYGNNGRFSLNCISDN